MEWIIVHVSEFEPKQPQLEPKPMNGDAISLRNVRPSRTENAVAYSIPKMVLKHIKQVQEL